MKPTMSQRIGPDQTRHKLSPNSTSCIVSLKNHHLNPGSQKMPSSDNSADTSPNNSNSNRATHGFHLGKNERDKLPIRVQMDCLCTYGPSKRQHGVIYRNSYRNNRHGSRALGMIVILIADCEIGGSPLAVALHSKNTLDNIHRINPERGVWG
jgi:hypothetical protein